ncbi:MAG: alcohol dehydrogenase catalytic domain-containing protein, partial [Halobacteriales archaeon]|nr:alcohol dehydrogenase catalytic domain-containing protein [Halobacteriales archaeon]
MKAAYFERHGGPEVLQVGEVPAPPLGPGDVRIRVKAAALNHLDLFVRDGWPGLKLPMPHVGGTDVAGVVSE